MADTYRPHHPYVPSDSAHSAHIPATTPAPTPHDQLLALPHATGTYRALRAYFGPAWRTMTWDDLLDWCYRQPRPPRDALTPVQQIPGVGPYGLHLLISMYCESSEVAR